MLYFLRMLGRDKLEQSLPKRGWIGCVVFAIVSCFVFAILLSILSLGGAVSAHADWNIVWSDEFNGTSLNTNTWFYDQGNCDGWGFNEFEYYTPQNVVVSNGMLRILALDDPTNGVPFTSGRINSSGTDQCTTPDQTPVEPDSYAVLYGLIEFRVKLPVGTGLWPQIWLFPQNTPYGDWPLCGEIDVLENFNSQTNSTLQGAIHYYGGSQFSQTYVQDITQWHTYGIYWTTNSISWIVDGVTNATATDWNPPPGFSSPAPFNIPFFFILDLAMGGGPTGSPTAEQMVPYLPAEMDVDYIRVYQQTAPLAISTVLTNSNIMLTWPTNIVCHLQTLSDPDGLGNPGEWVDIDGATNSPYIVSPTEDNAFFRLESP